MKSRITLFLIRSFILILIVCVGSFSFLAFYMNRQSTETIRTVGGIYMSGMNEQKERHFDTIIEMQLSPMEELLDSLSVEEMEDETLRSNLESSAKAQGFETLAFLFDDGTFDMIYGDAIVSLNLDPFLESLKKGEKKSVGRRGCRRKPDRLNWCASEWRCG